MKDTVTQKQKDTLFPQTTFSLLSPPFSFPQLFPFLTLSCRPTIHYLSLIQRPFHMRRMCTPTMNKTQIITTPNPFHRVSLMFKLSIVASFHHKSSITKTTLPWLWVIHQTTFIRHNHNRTDRDIDITYQMMSQKQFQGKTVPLRLHRIEALKPSTTRMGRK